MAEKIENSSEKPVIKKRKGPYTWKGGDEEGQGERISPEELMSPEEKEAERIAEEITSKAFGLEEISEKIEPEPEIKKPFARIIPAEEVVAAKKVTEVPVVGKAEEGAVLEANQKTAEEIGAARQTAVEKMTPEEQIGELEHNLKYRYSELFGELKDKKEPSGEIYDSIQTDQNELALLYEPEIRARVIKIFEAIRESFKGKDEKIDELIKTEVEKSEDKSLAGDFENRLDLYKKLLKGRKPEQVKKEEIFRKELGMIFDKIKLEAMNEVGYRLKEVQERKAKGKATIELRKEDAIERGRKLAEKYGVKSLEELKKLLGS